MDKPINWNKYSYTEEELRKAVAESASARASMIKLGLVGNGAGYKPILRLIKILNIDTTHWLGRGHLLGKKHNYTPPRPLMDILKENCFVQSWSLKQRLIEAKLLEDKCYLCGLTHWQGQKLSLHLDHINGTNDDNRLENLRILCPNCHSLTDTYTGKNKKKKIITNKIKQFGPNPGDYPKTKKNCIGCNKEILRWKSERCSACIMRGKTKINWPSNEELLERLKTTSYRKLAGELGISDNSIRKRLKKTQYPKSGSN